MTTWKTIEGFPNYSVSNDGQVKNNKSGKIIKQWIDTNGYPSVHLGKPIRRVHKLVAVAFIPNPRGLPEVNHLNGNKNDCDVFNLEWCTHRSNVLHSRHILHNEYKRHKGLVECVETGRVYSTVEAAARAVKRSSSAIKKCLYGKTKTSAGQHWRYRYDNQNRSDSRRKSTHSISCEGRGKECICLPKEQGVG